MSKDDMETATLNVVFDDKDDDNVDLKTEKMVKYFEDDYNMIYKFRRCNRR